MSGGHVANFKKLFRLNILLTLILNGVIVIAALVALNQYTSLHQSLILGIAGFVVLIVSVIQSYIISNILTKPTEYLAQAIFHISPNEHLVSAPNIENLTFGRELVATLARQIYDYASSGAIPAPETRSVAGKDLLDSLPVPVMGLDKHNKIALVNAAAEETFGLKNCLGLELASQLQMKFIGKSLQEWAIETKSKSINSVNTWQKVEISSNNGTIRSYFDLAATFRQKHPSNIEQLIVFFNHSETFESEDNAINLIALSVHEIRTPLTILRGYIDVLRQELDGKIDASTKQYIDRLSASSENLAAYMANVLSVAKADQNQLVIQLQEGSWEEFLTQAVEAMQTKAKVKGKEITLEIAKNLPTVALDDISIGEVLTNLVDNAIKYSPDDKKTIRIKASLTTDGSVKTIVQDEGVGIPDSVITNLFTRFYRNHRNRGHVLGTGLGLYVSKEIVSAHHGNIWIDSEEGKGTTASFTLIPYTRLADAEKTFNNGFKKVEHGWIKNHGMQRR